MARVGKRTVKVPAEESTQETLADLGEVPLVEEDVVLACGLIRGTSVEAHRIAALVDGGMSVAEILKDYPNLTPTHVDASVNYARAYPKQGRTYPRRTAKSAIRAGGDALASAFRDGDGDE
jgi:uncharacterized protein (DUF433 family)